MEYKMFQVRPGRNIRLKKIDPGYSLGHKDEVWAKTKLLKYTQKLSLLQYKLYAEKRHSLLICLQGMDAAGKDGVIRHVFSAMNPQGTRVCAFKVPTEEERSHDFLWRVEKQVPAKGEIAIFNRSHYEDVLAARVHKLVAKELWSERYDCINNFEKNLSESGTHILKFFLHISPGEQLARFKQRLDDPQRQWKISEADYAERQCWDKYMRAFEDVFSRTSTAYAPWYIIPADHKWFRNLLISKIIVDELESMEMQLPPVQVDIAAIRRKYHKAQKSR